MIDVLFGQSYYLHFDPKETEAMKPYPPLGTLYAASYIRNKGYDVALFDAMLAQSEAEWVTALERHKPRVAVIYEDGFNYLSKMCLTRMREAAFIMALRQRSAAVRSLSQAQTPQTTRTSTSTHGADAIIIGEGEITLGETLDAVSGKSDASSRDQLPGLATPGTPNPVSRGFEKHLDRFPFPAWDLVDVARYKKIWMDRHGYYSMNMVTTRGCPYHCNWCAKPIYGQRYNVRPARRRCP